MAPWEDFSPIFCPYLDIWGLASPTMHGEELKYITEAYETNWMSTVGKNINEVEKIAAEKAEVNYAVGLSCCTAALHLCVKLAGERLYGKPAISHGALEGKRVFCSDMTFDATLNPVVYEEITARFELYTSLERGLKDIQEGNTRPLSVALSDLRWRRKK